MKQFLFVSILFLLFFRGYFFEHKYIICCDNATINMPARQLYSTYAKQHVLPLWNPTILSGMPFLADINLGIVFPLMILYLVFPLFDAFMIEIIILHIMLFIGMYLLLHSIVKSSNAALFGALVVTFSGVSASFTNNISLLRSFSMFPFVFISYHAMCKSNKTINIVLAIISSALQIVSGHPQLTFYTHVVVFFYSVTRFRSNFFQVLRLYAIASVGSILLSAVQIFPFIELLSLSTRLDSATLHSVSNALSVKSIISFIIPLSVGNISTYGAWLQHGMLYGYVGIIPLVLLFTGLRYRKRLMFWYILMFVSVLYAFGERTPIFRLVEKVIPGMNMFRSPLISMSLYVVSVSVISSFMIGRISQQNIARVKRLLYGTCLLLVAVATVFSFPVMFTSVPYFHQYTFGQMDFISKEILFNVSYQSIAISILLVLASYADKRIFIHALASLTILELLIFSPNSFVYGNPETWKYSPVRSEIRSFLSNFDPSTHRLLINPVLMQRPDEAVFPKYSYVQDTDWQFAIAKNNIDSDLYPRADGYSSLVLKNIYDSVSPDHNDPTGIYLDWSNKYTTYLAVSDILVGKHEELPKPFILRHENRYIKLYFNERACPIFYFINGSECIQQGIKINVKNPIYVKLTAETNARKRLVFAESYYPGWKVTVDGAPGTIEPYLGFLKSVVLNPGMHDVEFSYSPITFYIGLLISVCTALYIVYVSVVQSAKNTQSILR